FHGLHCDCTTLSLNDRPETAFASQTDHLTSLEDRAGTRSCRVSLTEAWLFITLFYASSLLSVSRSGCLRFPVLVPPHSQKDRAHEKTSRVHPDRVARGDCHH